MSLVSVHVHIIYVVMCYDVMGRSSLFQRSTIKRLNTDFMQSFPSGIIRDMQRHTQIPFMAVQTGLCRFFMAFGGKVVDPAP